MAYLKRGLGAIALALIAMFILPRLKGSVEVACGYSAKLGCSSVFIQGRSPASVEATELSGLLGYLCAPLSVDRDDSSVSASTWFLPSFAGGVTRRAVFRGKRRGCTLLSPDHTHARPVPLPRMEEDDAIGERGGVVLGEPLRFIGDRVVEVEGLSEVVDVGAIRKVLDDEFSDRHRLKKEVALHTRAVLVVYDGQIVAERYGDGFDRGTPLLGWSMTKSVTSALYGVRIEQGGLPSNVSQRFGALEWGADDARALITHQQMLQMSSGLQFQEDYTGLTDATTMLFRSANVAGYAAAKRAQHPRGEHWAYSSGTTNLLSRKIRESFRHTPSSGGGGGGASPPDEAMEGRHRRHRREDDAAYWAFPYRSLFDPLGMSSMVMEMDESGTFIGSSYSYATARDWAKFGQLFLQRGVWKGRAFFPPNWVHHSTRPTSAPNKNGYGYQWWLSTSGGTGVRGNVEERWHRALPPDAYYASGFEEQILMVVPSKKLVIVRLGCTRVRNEWDKETFFKGILGAIKSTETNVSG